MELFLHNLQRMEFMAKIYSWPELNSVLEEALFAMAQVAWSVAYQIWRSKMVLVYSVMNIWTQNFSFFPKFTTENSSEVYYRKFFRSLLPKILAKFTTENSSEVYHRKFFRSLLTKILPKFQPKIPPKFTTENSSEVYNRKFLRSLLPKILPKFTAEKFKSTWKAAEKGTSDLTDTSFQPNVIFPIDLLRALLGKQTWRPKWR